MGLVYVPVYLWKGDSKYCCLNYIIGQGMVNSLYWALPAATHIPV